MSDNIETTYNSAIEAGKINGAIICATNSSGTFTYNKAIGTRTLLSGEKISSTLDDVLYLASATKLVTSIAALQGVDSGLLKLSDDVTTIFPALATKQILTGWSEDGETPILENREGPITLEMLLTHSAGVTYDFMNPSLQKWSSKFNAPQEGEKRAVEQAFAYPSAYQPGSNWMYSTGLDWAGRVIELATGRELITFMQENIFDKLSITSAQFNPVTRRELREKMVDLNPEDPHGTGNAVLGGNAEQNLRSQGGFGGHGLFISGCDYVKILHSLLANDGKLLKPETRNLLFSHHLSPEATTGFHSALQSPMGFFFRNGVDEATTVGFGLGGLLTLEDTKGFYGEGTLSWGGGMTLAWFVDPKNDLCGIGAVQAKLPLDMKGIGELKQAFRVGVYGGYGVWKEGKGE